MICSILRVSESSSERHKIMVTIIWLCIFPYWRICCRALWRRRFQHEWEQLAFPEIIKGVPVPVSVSESYKLCMKITLRYTQNQSIVVYGFGWSPYFCLDTDWGNSLLCLHSHSCIMSSQHQPQLNDKYVNISKPTFKGFFWKCGFEY
jgi:hypothetical protein